MSAPMNIQHRRTPSSYFATQPAHAHAHARSLSSQFGTSWSDPFEFTSRSPLTSALHLSASTSPPMGAAHLPSSYSMSMSASASALGLSVPMSMSCSPKADYFSFERDYCSNFACCGITLPDMHALVAHFEETHLGPADGLNFMPHGAPIPHSNPSAKPAPQVNTNTNASDAAMSLGPGDAPSPHSSVGPETPPPASHVPAYAFPPTGYPQLQVQTQMPPYIYASRADSASPSTSAYAHSPYAASPLSAGSPASSGAEHFDGSGSGSGSGFGSSEEHEREMEMEVEMDVLMSFDPLDGGVHTPLDSTPPSPLAPPVRPASVLRAAALKNSGAPDAPPVGFPPALFSAPALLSPSVEKEGSGLFLGGGRKEKRKERGSRAGSPASGLNNVARGTGAGAGTGGGAVRREKARKPGTIGSLLGARGVAVSSATSSGEESAGGEGESTKNVKEWEGAEKNEKAERNERPERVERAERSERGGKRTREKAYKCMKPGCTKSYLNPNGLKYHNAKGTCTFANGSAPPTPVTSSSSAPSTPITMELCVSSSQHATNSAVQSPLSVPSSSSSSASLVHTNAYQHQHQVHQTQTQYTGGVPIIAAPVPRDAPSVNVYALEPVGVGMGMVQTR